MAKSQGALILITAFIGALFLLSGFIFTLQGLGIVGPTSSFMFRSQTWIDNGLVVLVLGIILLGVALYFRMRSKSAKVSEQQQFSPGDKKTTAPSWSLSLSTGRDRISGRQHLQDQPKV